MPSILTHLAVGKELNKKLNRPEKNFLTGCIAPDLSKQIGISRFISHFENEDGEIQLDWFLKKYRNYIHEDYVLGYYIHLYTDYLWDKYFISEIFNDNKMMKKDGTTVTIVSENMARQYLYNDYSNMNLDLIDKYNLDFEFIYNKHEKIIDRVEEVPIENIDVLVNNTIDILNKNKYEKNFVFDFEDVQRFIDRSIEYIYAHLKEEGYIHD